MNKEASQFWAGIVEEEDEVRVYIHRTFEPGVLGYTQTEWIGVMAVVTTLQVFAGSHAQPSRISLGTRSPVPTGVKEIFGETDFRTKQPSVYIAFPRSMLARSQRPHQGDSRFNCPVRSRTHTLGESPNPILPGD